MSELKQANDKVYKYDAILRVIEIYENVPLSSGEIAQMIKNEHSSTAALIHHLLTVRNYIERDLYAHLDKIYEGKIYFRPNITYYKFRLTQSGKDRLTQLRQGKEYWNIFA